MFIRACMFGEFICDCIGTYMYVFSCICLYLRRCLYLNPSPLQTEIGWNAYKHVCVCICMYHMYMYIYACINMYLYIYVCMCIYVHLCRLYTINMFISACTCQAAVAHWHIQPHMTVQTGVRTPTTTIPQRYFVSEQISFCSENFSEKLQEGV